MSLILIFFIPLLATYLIAKVQLKRVNTQVKKQPKPIARTIVLLLVTIFLTLFTGIMHEIIASSYWGRENWYFDGYVWLIIFTTLVAMIYNPIAVFLVIYLSKREVLNNSK
jgi:ABC-type polysaccharide transport system permease subunit